MKLYYWRKIYIIYIYIYITDWKKLRRYLLA